METGILTREQFVDQFGQHGDIFAMGAQSLKAAAVPLPWLRRVPNEIAQAEKIAGDIWKAWRSSGLIDRMSRDEYVMHTTSPIGLKDTSKSTILSTDPSARGARANEAAIEQVVPHVYVSSIFSMLPRDMTAARVFRRDARPSSFGDVAQDVLERIDDLILNGAGITVKDPGTGASASAPGIANHPAPLGGITGTATAWNPSTNPPDTNTVFKEIIKAAHSLRRPSRLDSNIDSSIVVRGGLDLIVPEDKAELFDLDYSTSTSTVTTLAQRLQQSKAGIRVIFSPRLSGKAVLYPRNPNYVRMLVGFAPIILPENRPFNFTQSRDFVMIGGMVPAILQHPKLNNKAAIVEITGI